MNARSMDDERIICDTAILATYSCMSDWQNTAIDNLFAWSRCCTSHTIYVHIIHVSWYFDVCGSFCACIGRSYVSILGIVISHFAISLFMFIHMNLVALFSALSFDFFMEHLSCVRWIDEREREKQIMARYVYCWKWTSGCVFFVWSCVRANHIDNTKLNQNARKWVLFAVHWHIAALHRETDWTKPFSALYLHSSRTHLNCAQTLR